MWSEFARQTLYRILCIQDSGNRTVTKKEEAKCTINYLLQNNLIFHSTVNFLLDIFVKNHFSRRNFG